MRKMTWAVVSACFMLVCVVAVLAPVWVMGIGIYFVTTPNLKPEGGAMVAGVIGFVLSIPYGMLGKNVLVKMGLFP